MTVVLLHGAPLLQLRVSVQWTQRQPADHPQAEVLLRHAHLPLRLPENRWACPARFDIMIDIIAIIVVVVVVVILW